VGDGSVSKEPDQATYAHGMVVILTAMADTGWTFAGWSGDAGGDATPLTVTVDSRKSIAATFVEVGSVQGAVHDGAGRGLKGVTVTLSNETGDARAALVRTETTDPGGSYQFN